MATIQIEQLTFTHDGSYETIFDHVSLQLDTNWKLGFTGRNGRGKTTFMKLLMGAYEYRGRILAPVQFDYFPLVIADETQFVHEVILQIAPEAEEWQIRREMNLLELDDIFWQPYNTLSSGEKTKVMLIGLFLKEDNFLLIDEPTNHLDQHGRTVVANYLNRKKGFILVSHDRAFLDECTDHTLSINKTNIEIIKGSFSTWWEQKGLQDAYELAQNEKLNREIGRLKEAAAKTAKWSDQVEATKRKPSDSGSNGDLGFHDKGYIGHKAAKMMKRSKAAQQRSQKAVEEKEKLLKNIERTEELKIHHERHHADVFVSLDNVSLMFDQREILKNFNMTVSQGDRLVIRGANGTGKSTVLKLITGMLKSNSGSVNVASGLKISTVSQETDHLQGSLDDYGIKAGIDMTLFKTILRKLDFSRDQFEKDLSTYSAGQKKKVLIAKSLSEKAHLYIWDEPLNFIDVYSRMQIEQLLLTHQPTMILVEHDAAFVEKVATRQLSL